MLGEEDMPTKKFENNSRYSFTVMKRAIKNVNKDKKR
jgi:hypothetical protein